MTYRHDIRTEEEFKSDIKKASISEAEIALRLCIYHHDVKDEWPTLEPIGTDYSGEYKADKDVTIEADYKINNKLVEITKSNTICTRSFHEKECKVKKAITDKYYMVFVNGFKIDKEPNFVILDPKKLEELSIKSFDKYGLVPHLTKSGFINKPSYRFDISWFDNDWCILPELNLNILPNKYDIIKELINAQEVDNNKIL